MSVRWVCLRGCGNSGIAAVMALLVSALVGNPAMAQTETSCEPQFVSDTTGITVTWTPPDFTISSVTLDGTVFGTLSMPGTIPDGEPGRPALPVFTTPVGLPYGSRATLEIVSIETEVVDLPHQILPTGTPLPRRISDADDAVSAGAVEHIPDRGIYETDAFFPKEVAALGPTQQVRDHQLANLAVYPLALNPVSRQLSVVRSLQLRIEFSEPGPSFDLPAAGTDVGEPFDHALAAVLANPEAAQWTGPSPAAGSSGDSTPDQSNAAGEYKVVVSDGGLYQITYASLSNAGFDVGAVDTNTLRLTHGFPRQEVAIQVDDAAQRILFYAQPESNRYSDEHVFFLSCCGVAGQRMDSRTGAAVGSSGIVSRSVTIEENHEYDSISTARDGDHWYWQELIRGGTTSGVYDLQLPAPRTDVDAVLHVWLFGETSLSHKVRAAVNGTIVGDRMWSGKGAVDFTFSFPGSMMTSGRNEITLSLPGSGTAVESMWVDALAVTYATDEVENGQLLFTGESGQKDYELTGAAAPLLVFDVTDGAAPRRVQGFDVDGDTLTIGDADTEPVDYLVVPDGTVKDPLRVEAAMVFTDPPEGADYVIISHPDLAQAVAPLASYHASQGLRVVTVDVTAIYDAYGPGHIDPQAIKTFLSNAYENWTQPPPTYVLLVGDGTLDFKDYWATGAGNFIPPFLADVDPWIGEIATDNLFVTVVGDDQLPDMLLGRLPVNTPEETTVVVNKVLNYEEAAGPHWWYANQLIVSDNPEQWLDFYALANSVFGRLSYPFFGHRMYFASGSAGESYMYTNAASMTAALKARIEEGVGLITYVGHSSWLRWATETLFNVNNIQQLGNQERLPVVLELSCYTSRFQDPRWYDTFDEALLRHGNGGAVGTFGTTGEGALAGQDKIQQGFYAAVTDTGTPEVTLGAAALAARVAVDAAGGYDYMLDSYTLFGDPATLLRMNIPAGDWGFTQVLLPCVIRQ